MIQTGTAFPCTVQATLSEPLWVSKRRRGYHFQKCTLLWLILPCCRGIIRASATYSHKESPGWSDYRGLSRQFWVQRITVPFLERSFGATLLLYEEDKGSCPRHIVRTVVAFSRFAPCKLEKRRESAALSLAVEEIAHRGSAFGRLAFSRVGFGMSPVDLDLPAVRAIIGFVALLAVGGGAWWKFVRVERKVDGSVGRTYDPGMD